ncbi:MAG: ABC transporter substrate-binding protein [Rhodospirillaceae bacterium]|nr:ABC transporter substrate-binding protein [Rhodospirillaceae bacterium]
MDTKELERIHVGIPKMCKDLAAGKVSRREFLRTTTLLGLSAPVAYALVGEITGEEMIPAAHAQEEPQRGGTLRISMPVMEITDPATVDWSQKGNLLRFVIEPLVQLGADNIARPWLAESWEASDDLTQWTFRLRQNATWNNGDAFTADDVVATFTRWLDPATGSSNFGRFNALQNEAGDGIREDGVVKIDDHTVQFNLRTADLGLPELMTDYPALITHRSFAGDFQDNPIGTGPFTMTDFAVGQNASFARRPEGEYWNDGFWVDGIEVIDHGDDTNATLSALRSGQVDLIYEMQIGQVPAVQEVEELMLYETITAQTGVARMHVTEPPFDILQVRQAIQACIDHDLLLELAYEGLGVPGEDHHVAPVHPEYAEIPRIAQDYDRARELLAEAGFPDGIDITIDCVAAPTWEPNTCQVIAQMVRPAGINLTVNIMPGGTYWDRWTVAPFGFTSWTHRPLGVTVLNLAYRSGVPWNETGYANPDFDALLDQANGTYDVDERRAIMDQLETMLRDDAIIVQPYWRAIHTASRNNLRGFELQPAREFHLQNVWLAEA